jgi:predicted nucleotidyltransferase
MPTTLTHDPVIQDFLKGIEGVRPQIRRLILFGSRARGTHASDSDYDLLVVVSKKDPLLLDALYDTVMDVLLAHGRLVSLKIFEEAAFARLQALQTPFMKHIAHEGKPLG